MTGSGIKEILIETFSNEMFRNCQVINHQRFLEHGPVARA